jgi:hypothetical protein
VERPSTRRFTAFFNLPVIGQSVFRDFDEVLVGIAEVNGAHRAMASLRLTGRATTEIFSSRSWSSTSASLAAIFQTLRE